MCLFIAITLSLFRVPSGPQEVPEQVPACLREDGHHRCNDQNEQDFEDHCFLQCADGGAHFTGLGGEESVLATTEKIRGGCDGRMTCDEAVLH